MNKVAIVPGQDEQPPRTKGKPFVTGIKVALGLVLVAALFRYGIIDARALPVALDFPSHVAIALGFTLIAMHVGISRWHRLLQVQGLPIPYWRAWRISFIGMFTGVFLPGALGGDALRMYLACAHHPGQRSKVVLSIVVDRVLGLYSLLLTTLVPLALSLGAVLDQPLLAALAAMVLLGCVAVPVALPLVVWMARRLRNHALPSLERWPRLAQIILTSSEAAGLYLRNPRTLAIALMLGCVSHGATLGAIVTIAMMLDSQSLHWAQYALAGSSSVVSNLLPITPGGLGVGESVFDQVCRLLGGDPVRRYGATLFLWRSIASLACLPGAWAYVVYKRG